MNTMADRPREKSISTSNQIAPADNSVLQKRKTAVSHPITGEKRPFTTQKGVDTKKPLLKGTAKCVAVSGDTDASQRKLPAKRRLVVSSTPALGLLIAGFGSDKAEVVMYLGFVAFRAI